MKMPFFPLMMIGGLLITVTVAAKANVDTASSSNKVRECHNAMDLQEASLLEKDELINELERIIPETYINGDDDGEYYSEWNVISVKPLPMAVGTDEEEIFYEIAKNLCGKDVANKSWLVRIHFPKWEGTSANITKGTLLIAKSHEKGWLVWYRYN